MSDLDTSTALPGGRGGVLLPLGVAAAALIGGAYLTAVDPNAAGHYPTCPFLAVTGWYCPGCGALRAVHALGHGDLTTALARNPFTVVAVGCLAVTWVIWLRWTIQGVPLRWAMPTVPARTLYAVFGAILLFWVLRNVPGWTWLSPA
jgi:hypothetical protein